MDPRPLGMVIALVGAAGLVISALANPLGIGVEEAFGWLQITGVIAGAVLAVLGVAIASEWIPVRRRTEAASGPQTTIVSDSSPQQ